MRTRWPTRDCSRQDRVVVVEELNVETPKTKAFVSKLKEYDIDSALIVTENIDENLYLASRNLPKVKVCEAKNIDPVSLVAVEKVLFTVGAIKALEEQLA